MALLHVSQCAHRKLENLATIHLKYHSVGSGVQKCQTGKMTLERAPWGTMGTSPSEFFNPQTLWLSTRKFWQRRVWKYPQVVWWCSRFSPLVSWDARGSWTRKSPNTQPLLGWGLELHLGQLVVQLGRGNGILLTLVSTDSPEGEVWLVDQLYPKEKPTKPLALLLWCCIWEWWAAGRLPQPWPQLPLSLHHIPRCLAHMPCQMFLTFHLCITAPTSLTPAKDNTE